MNELTKAELRARFRRDLRRLEPAWREQGSALLRERVRRSPAWTEAATVLLFVPRPDEPDVWPLIADALSEGRQVGLPSFDPLTGVYGARRVRDPAADLVPGRYGLEEPQGGCPPIPLAGLDLVLVPGLAFTTDGGRLGRGGGFYDRLLAATGAVRMGAGLDEQIVPWLPLEPHDVDLDYILTPSATYTGRGRSA